MTLKHKIQNKTKKQGQTVHKSETKERDRQTDNMAFFTHGTSTNLVSSMNVILEDIRQTKNRCELVSEGQTFYRGASLLKIRSGTNRKIQALTYIFNKIF